LKEKDFLEELRGAVGMEVGDGSIRVHEGKTVNGIVCDESNDFGSGKLSFEDGSESEKHYHLVVSAEGTRSKLRPPSSAPSTEDRNYAVFRGNAPPLENDASFQTWGEGRSMRFATCPFPGGRVWFATTSLPSVLRETCAVARKDLLLRQFSGWHDPVSRLLRATPHDEIAMDLAVAHRRPADSSRPPRGPALHFVGDSSMTVDPVLAQGFTMAMEQAHHLKNALVRASQGNHRAPCADRLETALAGTRAVYESRLSGLLRSTEVVQGLAQPNSRVLGLVHKLCFRPLVRLVPHSIKKPIFNAFMKYSLGMPLR